MRVFHVKLINQKMTYHNFDNMYILVNTCIRFIHKLDKYIILLDKAYQIDSYN